MAHVPHSSCRSIGPDQGLLLACVPRQLSLETELFTSSFAMASMRSENFWVRVIELNLEECIPAMKSKGLTTYAKFAFGSDYTPQQADATMLSEQLLKPMAGENVSLIPPLRMLWWESWGVATA